MSIPDNRHRNSYLTRFWLPLGLAATMMIFALITQDVGIAAAMILLIGLSFYEHRARRR